MKIIDSHVHLYPEEIKSDKFVADLVVQNKLDYTEKGLLAHMSASKVAHALVISNRFSNNKYTIDLAKRNPKKFSAAVTLWRARSEKAAIRKVIEQLQNKNVKAVKFYPGYSPINVRDKKWSAIYLAAIKLNKAAIFHTGDTLYHTALLKYANPLVLDELAVAFPQLKIVIAHFGNPWLMDAAEIVYKNKNVYADLSAFFAGPLTSQPHLVRRVAEAIEHCGPEKLMFGSDFPVARIDESIKFIKLLKLPKLAQKSVFGETAAKVFNLQI